MGLRIGQGLAEARAICPELDVIEKDHIQDQNLLEALADWCDRYTPLVAMDGMQGLFLDITGCAHLFGGESAMLRDVLDRLYRLGFDVRGAISSSPGLSWALARFDDGQIVRESEAAPVLSPLPVSSLRLEESTVALLIRLGLKQVGDLMALPRAPLARRFGALVLLRLDQALGRVNEPISPRRPLAMLSVERQLSEPIRDQDMVLDLVAQLAMNVKGRLEERGEGARLFELLLFRVDGRVFRIEVGTSAPMRDAKRIASLYTERLNVLNDDLDAGYGFELVRLNLMASEPWQEVSAQLSADQGNMADPLPEFLDRVTARLGNDCLRLPLSIGRHWPERAAMMAPLSDGIPSDLAAACPPARGERPLRLFTRPEPVEVTAEVPHGPPLSFQWRRLGHRVARAEGPERLTPEWWIDGEEAQTRDYYRVEDSQGRRFWLFRQGLYERGSGHPGWFMHGIFA